MELKPVYLTTRGVPHGFINALISCEKLSQIPPGSVDSGNVIRLPFEVDCTGEIKPRDLTLAANATGRMLRQKSLEVYVDLVVLAPVMALIDAYGRKWGLGEDEFMRLHQVVYDPYAPERAEVVDTISDGLRLLENYTSSMEIQELPQAARND
jgi:hypothetical protein